MKEEFSIGLIVNPIAGMGGAVGLKGTDGKETLMKVLRLGAKPRAPKRGEAFLRRMRELIDGIRIYAAAGEMGEFEALRCGYKPSVFGERKRRTSAKDTKKAASEMKKLGLDLLIFCGGDGTARDIYDSVGTDIASLGIPAGVKIHSAVFSTNPQSAAEIASRYLKGELPLKELEVLDVDEEEVRRDRLNVKLYGFLLTPFEPSMIQGVKETTPTFENESMNQRGIARYVTEEMKHDTMYIVGPGTTTRAILEALGEEKTLTGVDLVFNKRLEAEDVSEKQILEAIRDKESAIIVSPIGGQGFIFGRGNLQISDEVIRKVGKDNIIVVATKSKLGRLKALRVDTGDPELDRSLRGFIRVISDYNEETVFRVE